ncbi:unnamed protein product [Phytophthora lilii]|uniref:Unnamed protein product n=1 Tax=Phytophthora lilii TaxID=2077276 RepID=A0A9W6WUY8_9STRA|nr:unnamed protein product [Phytophthora lilii]
MATFGGSDMQQLLALRLRSSRGGLSCSEVTVPQPKESKSEEAPTMLSKPVRVLSERIMSRGFEPTVVRLMENVHKVVRSQPGLISLETLSDVNDHHKYVVLSEVRLASGAVAVWGVSIDIVGVAVAVEVAEGLRGVDLQRGAQEVHGADQRGAGRAGQAHDHLQAARGGHLPAVRTRTQSVEVRNLVGDAVQGE